MTLIFGFMGGRPPRERKSAAAYASPDPLDPRLCGERAMTIRRGCANWTDGVFECVAEASFLSADANVLRDLSAAIS